MEEAKSTNQRFRANVKIGDENTAEKEVDVEKTLIKLRKVEVKECPPLSLGLLYNLAVAASAVLVFLWTGCGFHNYAAIVIWHAWNWQVVLFPQPLENLSGKIMSFATLLGGTIIARQISNPAVRTAYLMATLCFTWGRGNILLADSYLRSLPIGFRATFVFSFLDFGSSRYVTSIEYTQEYRRCIWQAVWSSLACAVTMGTLELVSIFFSPGFVRETLLVGTGSINFICGIYIGDALYTLPIFFLANRPQHALLPKPLMLSPWKAGTIQEWWAERFDTGIQPILFHNAYRPVRKLGCSRSLAMLSTFVLSGIIHCPMIMEFGASYLEFVHMFSFFLVQAAFIGLETWRKWPPHRLRTLLLLTLSSPLFVQPILSCLGYNPLYLLPLTN